MTQTLSTSSYLEAVLDAIIVPVGVLIRKLLESGNLALLLSQCSPDMHARP